MKIDKEGYIIIRNTTIGSLLLSGVAFVALNMCAAIIVSSIALLATLFVLRFFRLPSRETLNEIDSIYSPADGTIVVCERVFEEEYLKRECIQISVFMSVWNVHANWYPIKGEVAFFKHHHGDFMVAWHPKSSTENERTTVVIKQSNREVLLRQIAGAVARRIVCYAKDDKHVEQNQRMGFIKFGSRVDLFLPLDADIKVRLNDKVVGSQTVIAEFSDKKKQ